MTPPPRYDNASEEANLAATAQTKHTPNVRKILQSQKTFANHLDDWIAFQSVARDNPQATAPWAPPAPPSAAAAAASLKQRSTSSASHKPPKTKPSSAPSAAAAAAPKSEPPQQPAPDVPMPDAANAPPPPVHPPSDPQPSLPAPAPPPSSYPPDGAVLPPYDRAPPRAHPGDADPLLASRRVPFPTDEELRALMAAPPLSYLDARGSTDTSTGGAADNGSNGSGSGGPYPERKFCEVCGYWGRVKCGKCGGRVCALDCLETHREECVRRYGL